MQSSSTITGGKPRTYFTHGGKVHVEAAGGGPAAGSPEAGVVQEARAQAVLGSAKGVVKSGGGSKKRSRFSLFGKKD